MASRSTDKNPALKPKAVPARKRTPAKKVVSKTGARRAPVALPPTKAAGAKGLLRAGLTALGSVRDDVVKRQANAIETLLGIQPRKEEGEPRAFPGLDSFGIRKFEDVFDQRVATALQRLGMPSVQEVRELKAQIDALTERLDRLEASDRGDGGNGGSRRKR